MTLSARQVLATLGILLGLFLLATPWYGVANGWVEKQVTFAGVYTILGVLFSGITIVMFILHAIGLLIGFVDDLWHDNPTLSFPRKPHLPRAVAKLSASERSKGADK